MGCWSTCHRLAWGTFLWGATAIAQQELIGPSASKQDAPQTLPPVEVQAPRTSLIGPSLQWRPTNRTFIDMVGLFGTTGDSPVAEMFVIFGYQFGKRAGPNEISAPASTRGR